MRSCRSKHRWEETHGGSVSTVPGKETIMLGTKTCKLNDSLVAVMPSLLSALSSCDDLQGSCKSMSELMYELVDE